MAAARRFLTSLSPHLSDFGRDALVDAWRALLPADSVVAAPYGLRTRLRLVGTETIVLTGGYAAAQPDDRIPADSLVTLWNHAYRVAPSDDADALAVSTGTGVPLAPDALAAAATAVAGELGLSAVRVFRLDQDDVDATRELVRAFRRLTDLPVTVVAHAASVADTVTALSGCRLVVGHDETATAVAASIGLAVVRLDSVTDVTEAYLAIRAGAADPITGAAGPISDATPSDGARTLAFTLDAWARGRLSTADLRAARTDVTRSSDLIEA